MNKFKEILQEIKHTSIKRKGVLKRLSLEFVKEFRQSGLRTTVTPYNHTVGKPPPPVIEDPPLLEDPLQKIS